jgi:hypothetical protein
MINSRRSSLKDFMKALRESEPEEAEKKDPRS